MNQPQTPPEVPTRSATAHSVLWTVGGSILRFLFAGITTLILTRLLTPDDFGLIAITTAAQILITHIATVGFHDAIIQRQDMNWIAVNTAFWSLMIVSGGFALLVILLSPLIALAFGLPRLTPLLIGVALASLIRPLSIAPRALLARRMDFRTPTLARALGMALAGIVAVTLALLGAGPWSLVAHTAVMNVIASALIWRAVAWTPTRQTSRAVLSDIWHFAPSVAIFTITTYVVSEADNQFIGYALGSKPLGYYVVAYAFMTWAVRDILGGIGVVLYPVFARLQDDHLRLESAYREGLQLSTLFAFPVLSFITVTAPVLIPWLIGPRWESAVLAAQILALNGLRESTMMLNGSVYRAVGKPQFHAMLGVANVVCYLPAFWIGLDFGIEGVALFYALTGVLLHPVSLWMLLKTGGLSLRGWLSALAPAALAGGLMALMSALTLNLARDLGTFNALLMTLLAAGATYGAALWWLKPFALRRVITAGLRILQNGRVWAARRNLP